MIPSHDHAYYLPTAEGSDRFRITHVTVLAPSGFSEGEVEALSGIRHLEIGGSRPLPLRAQLIGLGTEAEFTNEMFRKSRAWQCVTPFIAWRHYKQRGADRDELPANRHPVDAFLELLAREALAKEGFPEPTSVKVVPSQDVAIPAIDFQRMRDGAGYEKASRWFGMMRIEFASEVFRPMAFGHSCHFGMGLLLPDTAIIHS